jgi:NAD(P)-dependent dehydrogenase (short-subunit alcohol dehydrogenase family)
MSVMRELEGRNVVVTGAGGGLGPAVVERLLKAGAAVLAPQRRPADGAARPGLNITGGVDLADEGAVAAYYAGLPPLWASVHVAGGYAGGKLAETTAALARAQLELNFLTTLLCCREAVARIRPSGAGGRLLNVTSRAALVPGPGSAAYAASKAAVSSLTQVLAAELRDENIWVNAIAPSTIDTAANRAAMPDADRSRWAAPADIAEAVLWLISPANTTVTGSIVPVYGRG